MTCTGVETVIGFDLIETLRINRPLELVIVPSRCCITSAVTVWPTCHRIGLPVNQDIAEIPKRKKNIVSVNIRSLALILKIINDKNVTHLIVNMRGLSCRIKRRWT